MSKSFSIFIDGQRIDVSEYLLNLARIFETTPRVGSSLDIPEGSRLILISDTFALETARVLSHIADSLEVE